MRRAMDMDDAYMQAEEDMEIDLEEALESFTKEFDREPKVDELLQLKKEINYDIDSRVQGIMESIADDYDRYDER